jgi:hypothetical protein
VVATNRLRWQRRTKEALLAAKVLAKGGKAKGKEVQAHSLVARLQQQRNKQCQWPKPHNL